MAELGHCKTCTGKVSSEAKSCPHCGQPFPFYGLMMEVAHQAFHNWKRGETTGDWEPLLSMLTEEAKSSSPYKNGWSNFRGRETPTEIFLRRDYVTTFNGVKDTIVFEFIVQSSRPEPSATDGRVIYQSHGTLLVRTQEDKITEISHFYGS